MSTFADLLVTGKITVRAPVVERDRASNVVIDIGHPDFPSCHLCASRKMKKVGE
jgi:hypothetical protein